MPRGAGRLQHWGDPPDSCDLIVDTRHLDRILEHEPAESTVTVQAGVRLTDLEQVVESGGQTLALLPPRQASVGTVGALIATNAAGRMRSADCATRPPTPGRWCAWRSRLASSPGR